MSIFKFLITISTAYFILIGSLSVNVSSEVITSFQGQRSGEAIYIMAKSGEEITKTFELNNISNTSAQVELEVNPLKHIESGAVTVSNLSQDAQPTITFQVKNVAISENTTSKIPLTITIPQNLTPKEYGFGITISTVTNTDSTIQSKIRSGVKLYIAVEGEAPTVSVKTENLKKYNPTSFSFETTQTGTAFSRLSGKYTLLSEGKEVRTGEFVRDLVEFDRPITHTIAGISQLFDADELRLSYSIKPLNNSTTKYSTEEKLLSVSFDKTNPFGITNTKIPTDSTSLFLLAFVCIYSLFVYKKVAGS